MPHLSTAERIGREIGRKEVLRDLIAAKFGPLTGQVIAKIDRLSDRQIDRLIKEILAANSLLARISVGPRRQRERLRLGACGQVPLRGTEFRGSSPTLLRANNSLEELGLVP